MSLYYSTNKMILIGSLINSRCYRMQLQGQVIGGGSQARRQQHRQYRHFWNCWSRILRDEVLSSIIIVNILIMIVIILIIVVINLIVMEIILNINRGSPSSTADSRPPCSVRASTAPSSSGCTPTSSPGKRRAFWVGLNINLSGGEIGPKN